MTGRVVSSGESEGRRARSEAAAKPAAKASSKSVSGSGRSARSVSGSSGVSGAASGLSKAGTARAFRAARSAGTAKAPRTGGFAKVSGSGRTGGSAAVASASGAGSGASRVRKPRSLKASRTLRSSRSASSSAVASASSSRPVESTPWATDAGRRPTRSQPGGFVDARGLGTDRPVGERLRSDEGAGPFRRPKVIGFTARAKEERRAKAVTALIRAGVALAVVAVVSALVWLLFFSPALKLQADRISVHGANEWVTAEQVSSIASEQTGRSLLVVSTGSIADRLKAMPGVTSADVSKQWPHGLTVTVAAQKPAAVLKAADGSLTAVDSQARVLNAVGASVAGIPVIDVDNVSDGLDSRAVQQALQILASLPESMRQRISSVTAKTQDSVTTVLDGGNYTVVWGDASQLALKKAEVDKILNDPAVIGDKHQVDVTSPKKPIIK
ncbi:cell division protein FtsQ/DivIB [Bifidobacterium avesanii]|uniref:FtsQ-type POTRA domain-containing protein n=1 Tax=Bifidobacterium avesanii TaxID=1798157 RepID=A0A7K3TJC9_9BIFI|nr:FtsQ-type POTRA domain-containing protein [Bifidobacterium avesanii]KAB8289941.1 cell division protein FtsQ [Bifidobacterium avesanii]NEG78819.1 FtsQ-type POTRA domain-containing protein [Bifidobacterium avesanii]